MVTSGKDAGMTGTVAAVLRERNRAVVEGLNLVKKHVKPPPGGDKSQGGIVTVESPLHISKLSLLDPVTGRPCRVAFKFLEDGTKVRVSRGSSASGQIIPRPDILKERRKPRPTDGSQVGQLDTPQGEAHKVSYQHGQMDEDVGLPPVRFVNGRWELDVSRMGPLAPMPAPVRPAFRRPRKPAGSGNGAAAASTQAEVNSGS